MELARVFPRRTKATPDDEMAFFGEPDLLTQTLGIDRVHIDCTFTADKPKAEALAESWQRIAPTYVSGVAYEDPRLGKEAHTPDLEFVAGRYIKSGYTFTSRGCPRRCWFCSVWQRRPQATPIPNYPDGWNVLDDNLLACPEDHVRSVFTMLASQERRVEFTGGLEALALQDYQVGLLGDLKPSPNCFFAYDPGDPFETLESAATRMLSAGFTQESHRLRCYVLIGYPKDTFALAEKRLLEMIRIGFTPMAMLWQPETPAAEKHRPPPEWKKFQRQWVRPAIIHATKHGVGI